MGWAGRLWRRLRTRDRATPLSLIDEAVFYLETYIHFLDMELHPRDTKSYYLHDDDDDLPVLQVVELQFVITVIRQAIAEMESG
jgi:hypothetical protein